MTHSLNSDAAIARDPRATRLLVLTTFGTPRLQLVTEAAEPGAAPLAFADEPKAETGQAPALAAYLACIPGRTANREELAAILFHAQDRSKQLGQLRRLLSRLRTKFGSEYFHADELIIRLDPAVQVDRDAFLAAADASDHARAVTLYSADFFSQHSSRVADFDDWAAGERLRLRAIFRRSAQFAVQELLSDRRFQDAQTLARRVRDLDVLDQAGWRLLLETQIASRATAFVGATADEFERQLQSEGLSCDTESAAVLRRARKPVDAAHPSEDDGESPLLANIEPVGREREFRTLLDGWKAAQRNRSRVILILGAPGLGKSALLKDLQARIRAAGQRAVLVTANRSAKELPYAFASGVARALVKLRGAGAVSPESANSLVALDPTLSSTYPNARADVAVDDEALRRRMHAVDDLLGSVTEEAPLALLLDDLHWADARSRMLMENVLSGAPERSLLCVASYRTAAGRQRAGVSTQTMSDTGGSSEGIIAIDGAQSLPLTALTLNEVTQLVSTASTLPDEPWAQRFVSTLHRVSAGVPLYVIETLQLCLDEGEIAATDDGWHSPDHVALDLLLNHGGSLARRLRRLDQAERDIMHLLAVAGGRLPFVVLQAAATGVAATHGVSLADILGSLEQKRLVGQAGDEWAIAHDEFTACLLQELPPEDRPPLQSRIGVALQELALLTQRPSDRTRLRLAAALLLASGDAGALDSLVSAARHAAKRDGWFVSDRALLVELVGPAQAELLRQARRVGHTPPQIAKSSWAAERTMIFVGGIVAALCAVFVLSRTPRTSTATVAVSTSGDSSLVLDALVSDSVSVRRTIYPITATQFAAADDKPLSVTELTASPVAFSIPTTEEVARPGTGGEWAVVTDVLSPDGPTIALIGSDGRPSVLTAGGGINVHPDWSPDGRQLAFATSRWSERGHTALAIVTVPGRAVRRLLSATSDVSDRSPRWSSDGTRIAFVRSHWRDGMDEACVVTIDARQLRCVRLPRAEGTFWLNWTSDSTLRAQYFAASLERSIDLQLGASLAAQAAVDLQGGCDWTLSLTSACHLPTDPKRATVTIASASGPPPITRTLVAPPGASSLSFRWRWRTAPATMIDSVRVQATTGEPIVGVPFHLRSSRWRRLDGWHPAFATRWQSSDTTIASVDSAGIVYPRRAGRVVITASLQGWRQATRTLQIRTVVARTLIEEDWRDGENRSWRTFGEPRPRIVETTNGAAWNNGGDGTYASGAYWRQPLDPRDGLTVDVRLSTPIKALQWQMQDVQLLLNPRTAAIDAWDHRTGYFWGETRGWDNSCGIRIPSAEGLATSRLIGLSAGTSGLNAPTKAAWRSGVWYDLRLQLFPDGRCGIAIDGVPIATGNTAVNATAVQLALWGNSVATTMAVGPIRVRTGVATDIRWPHTTR